MSARHWMTTFTLAALAPCLAVAARPVARHAAGRDSARRRAASRRSVHAVGHDHRPAALRRLLHLRAGRRGAAALHAAYPELTTLEVVGKSEEGREIWAMTVNNPKTGRRRSTSPACTWTPTSTATRSRAARCACTSSTGCSPGTARTSRSPSSSTATPSTSSRSVNVDGRWHFFNDPNTPSSGRSVRVPRDDDRDGLVDEDFPDDLDGDGNICRMRRKDPFGQWKTDPEDPRLMVRVKPGEKGEWTMLGEEGLDNDGDGKVNEDARGLPRRQPQLGRGTGRRPTSRQAPATSRSRRRDARDRGSSSTAPTSSRLRAPQQRRHVPARALHQGATSR